MIEKHNSSSIHKICLKHQLISDKIEYTHFYHIVRDFNKLISQEIIDGYTFDCILGEFFIEKRARKRRAIDWGTSNARKKQLIEEGKTPFNKETAPNGEHWMVYFTQGVFFGWKWKKCKGAIEWYNFIPSIFNKRDLGKVVKKKVKDQEEDYRTYNENSFKSPYTLKDFANLQTL